MMAGQNEIQISKFKAKVYNILLHFKKKYVFIQRNSVLKGFFLLFSLFSILLILFLLNKKTLIHGDDFVYSYIFTTMNPITSLMDLIESQKTHYMVWGGRTVVHSILQLLLTLPPLVIDFINSLVFVLFVYLIYLHIKGRNAHSLILLTVCFCFTWLLQPVFGDTVLWITGSVNYLWGTTILLAFLLPYRFYRGKTKNKITEILLALGYTIFGVIAGWTTENTSAAIILMAILFLFYFRLNNWKIPFWSVSGIIGAIAGYAMMITAPGNFERAAGASVSPSKMIFNIFSATQGYVDYMGVLLLAAVILYFIFIKSASKNKTGITLILAIYFIGTLAGTYSMILSPFFAARSWFGIITFGIIIFGIALYNLNSSETINKLIKFSFFTYCTLAFLLSFYDAYKDINSLEKERIEQISAISSAREAGKDTITIKMLAPATKFGLLDTPYATKYMSHYYGIGIKYEK